MTNTTNTNRPNRYAGSCVACGGHVAPGQGHLVAKYNGRWTVGHNPCPGMVEPVAAVPTFRPGFCPAHPANSVGEHNDGICHDCEMEAIAAYERRGYAVLGFPPGSHDGGL